MKKYIIGLFSAICLMGAGCTEFEEFPPVDMGEGPAVEVSLTQIAGEDDAFTLTVTPAEGTVYYAYMISNDSLVVDADDLLQGDYQGATVVNVANKPSVSENFTNQEVGVVYYVYAVAANEQGLCGAIASASLDMPDKIAPHLVDIPENYQYPTTNNHRSVTLTFNETVTRGEGAITYDVTRGNLESYASGTIETVVIDNETVTITLPESVVFDENEAVTYVFLDFAAGAFVDASGNQSAAIKGGIDDEGQVAAPWWQYVPGQGGGDTELVGTFGFLYVSYDFNAQAPGEDVYRFDTEFSLKHENDPDTIQIDFQKYFTGINQPIYIDAVTTETGFKILDLSILGIFTMQDTSGKTYDVIMCFAGNMNSETDYFEYINFEPNEEGRYEPDRWCGLYLFDYNYINDPKNPNFDMGWYDLWTYSEFFKGSVDDLSSAQAKKSSLQRFANKKNITVSNMRLLKGVEQVKALSAIQHVGDRKSVV